MNETHGSDRPTEQQLDDDNKFDNWLISIERKMNQQAAKIHQKSHG